MNARWTQLDLLEEWKDHDDFLRAERLRQLEECEAEIERALAVFSAHADALGITEDELIDRFLSRPFGREVTP